MPPPGFKSVTIASDVLELAHRIRRLIVERGTASLPDDAIPPEYRGKVDGFSIGEILKIAILSFEKRIYEGRQLTRYGDRRKKMPR